MSQLYIRLRTGFFTHRKTVRLRAIIGDDAYWVVPRLWAYAAEHQPNGDLSGYSSEELAMLIGCDKHATSILKALKDAGFIENDGKIHDWGEHNGYHERYSDRAKIAAAARWSKESPPTPPKEEIGKRKEERGGKHCIKHACSIDQAWLAELSANPTYQGINITVELGKMTAWCQANRRQPTRRFFINWLNRADRPLQSPNQAISGMTAPQKIADLSRRGIIAI